MSELIIHPVALEASSNLIEEQSFSELIGDFLQEQDLDLGDDQERIIQQAVQMLEQHEIEAEFLDNKENLLLLLALGEEWLKSKTLREKIRVLQLLKILAVIKEAESSSETTSLRVKRLSSLGYKSLGEDYDPGSSITGEISGKVLAMFEEMCSYKNDTLSAETNEWLLANKATLKLGLAKKSLGITTPDQPFKVVVIDRTSSEMMRQWGSSGALFSGIESEDKIPVLVICHDAGVVDKNTVEHEWNHSQGSWFAGYRNLFFKGFTEAITEYSTQKPYSYGDERVIFQEILERIPGIKDLIIKGYLGDQQARVEADVELVKTYGLKGLLLLSRMLFVKTIDLVSPRRIHLDIEVAKHFDPGRDPSLGRRLRFDREEKTKKQSRRRTPKWG